eukprot:CAMPEP_0178391270 /NCGR_PEP_ID=MMETSP0689_2-20121128/11080_1 /TAXON_ID=160604 /ORGANISM="Amphidinium massartii, Strain CS-259" /LENGTH=204 /DNA_ID=CAMNT_0020011815 /DNA_START=516 /DNA_END=1130 /DNA_ORIENTATION=-
MSRTTGLPNVPIQRSVPWMKAAMRICVGIAHIHVPQAIQIDEPSVLTGPIANRMATAIDLLVCRSTCMQADNVVSPIHMYILLRRFATNEFNTTWHMQCLKARISNVTSSNRVPDVPHKPGPQRIIGLLGVCIGVADIGISESIQVYEPPVSLSPEPDGVVRANLPIRNTTAMQAYELVLAIHCPILHLCCTTNDLNRCWRSCH